ncbi:MAG: hypothetical protein E2598_07905 [Sphingobium sp.]|nr:hypothetical protein [Sphingobium sp.]
MEDPQCGIWPAHHGGTPQRLEKQGFDRGERAPHIACFILPSFLSAIFCLSSDFLFFLHQSGTPHEYRASAFRWLSDDG